MSFPRGYPFTNVVMVACDGLGEFCVVLRAVLFFVFVVFLKECVHCVEFWLVVLQHPGLHWLGHVLFFLGLVTLSPRHAC